MIQPIRIGRLLRKQLDVLVVINLIKSHRRSSVCVLQRKHLVKSEKVAIEFSGSVEVTREYSKVGQPKNLGTLWRRLRRENTRGQHRYCQASTHAPPECLHHEFKNIINTHHPIAFPIRTTSCSLKRYALAVPELVVQ